MRQILSCDAHLDVTGTEGEKAQTSAADAELDALYALVPDDFRASLQECSQAEQKEFLYGHLRENGNVLVWDGNRLIKEGETISAEQKEQDRIDRLRTKIARLLAKDPRK